MSKLRVYDFAKKYNIPSKEFVAILNKFNIPVKNHMSALTDQQVAEFEEKFDKDKYQKSLETESKKEVIKDKVAPKPVNAEKKAAPAVKSQPKTPQKNQKKSKQYRGQCA